MNGPHQGSRPNALSAFEPQLDEQHDRAGPAKRADQVQRAELQRPHVRRRRTRSGSPCAAPAGTGRPARSALRARGRDRMTRRGYCAQLADSDRASGCGRAAGRTRSDRRSSRRARRRPARRPSSACRSSRPRTPCCSRSRPRGSAKETMVRGRAITQASTSTSRTTAATRCDLIVRSSLEYTGICIACGGAARAVGFGRGACEQLHVGRHVDVQRLDVDAAPDAAHDELVALAAASGRTRSTGSRRACDPAATVRHLDARRCRRARAFT